MRTAPLAPLAPLVSGVERVVEPGLVVGVRLVAAADFAALFVPSEYGVSWDDVVDHVSDEKCCGDWMEPGANAALAASVAAGGVRVPVQVVGDVVVDGHHRVACALLAGCPVPVEAGVELYEGQVEAARVGCPRG